MVKMLTLVAAAALAAQAALADPGGWGGSEVGHES